VEFGRLFGIANIKVTLEGGLTLIAQRSITAEGY
jgi:hypothetical protein